MQVGDLICDMYEKENDKKSIGIILKKIRKNFYKVYWIKHPSWIFHEKTENVPMSIMVKLTTNE